MKFLKFFATAIENQFEYMNHFLVFCKMNSLILKIFCYEKDTNSKKKSSCSRFSAGSKRSTGTSGWLTATFIAGI